MQGYPSSSWTVRAGRGRGGKGKSDWVYAEARGETKGDITTQGKGKKGKGRWESRPNWENLRGKDWDKSKDKPEEKPKA